MDKVILLVVLAGLVAVAVKFRADAARARRETIQRITADHQSRATLSPTADLFREVGVPVPDALDAALPDPVAAPAPDPTTDLAAVFAGIELPAGLVAQEDVDPHHLTLISPEPAEVVTAQLEAEIERIGGSLNWESETQGDVTKGDGRASIAVESNDSGTTVRVQAR